MNGFGHYLQITNNNVTGNQGTVGGGIRVGNPSVVNPGAAGTQFYQSSFNDHITISHNQIVTNGANGQTIASGAGIGLFTGSDNYVVSDCWICGNYSTLAGAGIGHQGLSDQGLIRNNMIVFNESFDEGGGIFLSGETPLTGLLGPEGEAPPAGAPLLTPGAGNVLVKDNLIQGNKGGNIGGGITLFHYNGLDVEFNPDNNPADPEGDPTWYRAEIYNNMIVNNLSGAFGAGIAIVDALDAVIVNNTISNNDSTATSEFAFGSVPNLEGTEGFVLSPTALTTPMPSGIGIQLFSSDLVTSISTSLRAGYGDFGGAITPVLVNNIVTNNFAYYWNGYDPLNSLAALTLAGVYDMGVFGVPGARPNPHYSLLTNTTNYADTTTNIVGDPKFILTYRNNIGATQGGATLGNFVSFGYTPMTLSGNYHIQRSSPALDSGDITALSTYGLYSLGSHLDYDIDTEKRPMGYTNPAKPDMGADEYNSKGDVNCDANVTAQDALLTLRYVVDNTQTLACPLNGDVFTITPTGKPIGNGTVDLFDVLGILQRATGMVIW